jgi:hypothetical protein
MLSAHLEDQSAVFSTQVLQEYFVAATRIGLPAEIAQQHVAIYAQANVVQVTTELILAAIDLHRLHKLSFWDALNAVGACCRMQRPLQRGHEAGPELRRRNDRESILPLRLWTNPAMRDQQARMSADT